MMPRTASIWMLLPVLFGLAAMAWAEEGEAPALEASVDARVELLSIVFRLAGNPEYNQPASASPYADRVAEWFGPHREHAAVRMAARLRRTRSISYDAVMSLAVHISDARTVQERVPFEPRPESLEGRWRVRDAREFMEALRAFVRDTEFQDFLEENAEFHAKAAARLTEVLGRHRLRPWFDAFFGVRASATFTVEIGLLTGGGSYGVHSVDRDGREVISPVIGVWRFDDDGLPVFTDSIVSTVVHEFCHAYVNHVVAAHAADLEEAGRRLYQHCQEIMRQQAYSNWLTMLNESLVRASTVRFVLATQGKKAAAEQASYEAGRGFAWVADLAALLGEFESDRETYPDLDAFMPQVTAFFDRYSRAYDEQARRAPRVVSTTPASGAVDVDPALDALTIVFDRPMQDRSWSIVRTEAPFPEIAGDISYDAARKVLTVPVALQAGTTYRLLLNSGRFQEFRSEEGVPLQPVEVTFTTR